MDCVTDQLKKSELGRMVLDGLLRDVVEKRQALYERLDSTAKEQEPKKEEAKPPPPPQVTLEVTPQQAPATTIEVPLFILSHDVSVIHLIKLHHKNSMTTHVLTFWAQLFKASFG